MASSGSYSFGVTRDDIIRQALLNIKKLDSDDGGGPSPTDITDCSRVLNMMCKQWMGKSDFAPGLKVWSRKRGFMLLSNLTGQYTIGPSTLNWTNTLTQSVSMANAAQGATSVVVADPTQFAVNGNIAIQLSSGLSYGTVSAINGNAVTFSPGLTGASVSGAVVFGLVAGAQVPLMIEACVLRDRYNADEPINVFKDVQAYTFLTNKGDPTNIGDPTSILYERGINTGSIFTDVGASQDVTKYLMITYQEPVQDFINPTDSPYYPQEWYLALCWGLSEQICPMYGANWTDKMELLKKNAIMIARNTGSENSELYFQPGNDH